MFCCFYLHLNMILSSFIIFLISALVLTFHQTDEAISLVFPLCCCFVTNFFFHPFSASSKTIHTATCGRLGLCTYTTACMSFYDLFRSCQVFGGLLLSVIWLGGHAGGCSVKNALTCGYRAFSVAAPSLEHPPIPLSTGKHPAINQTSPQSSPFQVPFTSYLLPLPPRIIQKYIAAGSNGRVFLNIANFCKIDMIQTCISYMYTVTVVTWNRITGLFGLK